MANSLFALLFVALFGLSANAEAPQSVPVVSAQTFSVGKSWTWDYFELTGAMYSTERYTVLSVQGSVVWIEMASDYRGGQNLNSHHRIRVDIEKCLAAYKNPAQKKPWSIQMYYLVNGSWEKFDQNKTLAFEEKFNCNPHVFTHRSAAYLTIFETVDGVPAFQQKRFGQIESSWFGMSGSLAGIGVQKKFISDPGLNYVMKLR